MLHGRYGMTETVQLGGKILLTGFNGLLGSWLVEELKKIASYWTGTKMKLLIKY